MKRVICSQQLTTQTYLSKRIQEYHGVNKTAADIVARWYIEEDSVGDFDSVEELLECMPKDLPSMLAYCTNESEIAVVSDAFEVEPGRKPIWQR